MTARIWHNPRCSKSRQTLALLQERGVDVEEVRYLDAPPSRDELVAALALLGTTASEFIRSGEAAFKELGLKGASEDALLDAMVANPKLIQRPVVFANGAARVGRPPEAVLELFEA